MRREGQDGGQRGGQRRGTDDKDKVSTRKSQADGRRGWRFTQKAQTGLIRKHSNPSMMFTGGQAHRKEELRQVEKLTKTLPAGLKLEEIKQASLPSEDNQDSMYKPSI